MKDKKNKQNNRILQSRFKELLARKMRLEDRYIGYEDVAAETGVSKSSIQKWANNALGRRDDTATIAFMTYFDCTIDELLVVKELDSTEDDESEGQIKEALVA